MRRNVSLWDKLLDGTPLAWRSEAACRNMNLDLFYPEIGEKIAPEVRAACAQCPVFDQCYNHAIEHEQYGFWAGTTITDRQRLRKRRQAG